VRRKEGEGKIVPKRKRGPRAEGWGKSRRKNTPLRKKGNTWGKERGHFNQKMEGIETAKNTRDAERGFCKRGERNLEKKT